MEYVGLIIAVLLLIYWNLWRLGVGESPRKKREKEYLERKQLEKEYLEKL